VATATGVETWRFDNDAEANAFTSKLKERVYKDTAVKGVGLLGPGGSIAAGIAKGVDAVKRLTGDKDENDLPPARERWFAGGLKAEGTASFSGLQSVRADVNGVASRALGGKTGPDGTTLYYETNKSLSGEVSAGPIGDGAGWAGKTLYALQFDKKYRPVKLSVTGARELSGKLALAGQPNFSGVLGELGRKTNVRASGGLTTSAEYNAVLTLDDPVDEQAALAFLGSLGPGPKSKLRSELAAGLLKRFDAAPEISVNEYAGNRREYGADASAAAGLKLGAAGGYKAGASELTNAQYLSPSGGWVRWSKCLDR